MEFLIAIVPSMGVLLLFCVLVGAMIRADQQEREAASRKAAAKEMPKPSAVSGPPGQQGD